MNSHFMWYLTRGSGVVTTILLTASVLLGLTTVSRWSSGRWPRFVVEGLHRNVSLLAAVFLALHIATSVLDGYVSITWLNAVVPFGEKYKPFWLALGVLAFDAFAAVTVTSVLRARIGRRVWRAVHWLAYGCWAFAIAHGLGIGSDRHQGWFEVINLVAVASVVAAGTWRLSAPIRTPQRQGALR